MSESALLELRQLLTTCTADLRERRDERALSRLSRWTPDGLPYGVRTLAEAGIRAARRHLIHGDLDLARDALEEVARVVGE